MKKINSPEFSRRILIVEDEPAYMKLMHDQLTQNGFAVLEAKNGLEGLAIAKASHPDLILLDIKMPAMNGLTMLDELRKDAYGNAANVIILTNLEPTDKILQKVIEDQPTYYLIKSDIQLGELIGKIKNILLSDKNPSN